jgi:xanthine/uracil permease
MQETLVIGSFQLDGIGCGTFGAIFLNLILYGGERLKACLKSRRRKEQPTARETLDP